MGKISDVHKASKPSAAEALLRKLAPTPAEQYQNVSVVSICPKDGGLHQLRLNMGQDHPHRFGLWEICCFGASQSCAPQFPPSNAIAREKQAEFRELVAGYKPRQEALVRLTKSLQSAHNALSDLGSEDFPPLPKETNASLDLSLRKCADFLEVMRPDAVPVTVARDRNGNRMVRAVPARVKSKPAARVKAKSKASALAKAKARAPAKVKLTTGKRVSSPEISPISVSDSVSVAGSGDSFGEQVGSNMDGNDDLILPIEDYNIENDAQDAVLTIVVFSKSTMPSKKLLYVPKETCFQFTDYDLRLTFSTRTYLRYSSHSKSYKSSADPVNLAAQGRTILYVHNALTKEHHTEIARWEAEIRAQGRALRKLQEQQHRQYRPRERTPPIACSSQTLIEDLPASSSKKRKGSESSTRNKKAFNLRAAYMESDVLNVGKNLYTLCSLLPEQADRTRPDALSQWSPGQRDRFLLRMSGAGGDSGLGAQGTVSTPGSVVTVERRIFFHLPGGFKEQHRPQDLDDEGTSCRHGDTANAFMGTQRKVKAFTWIPPPRANLCYTTPSTMSNDAQHFCRGPKPFINITPLPTNFRRHPLAGRVLFENEHRDAILTEAKSNAAAKGEAVLAHYQPVLKAKWHGLSDEARAGYIDRAVEVTKNTEAHAGAHQAAFVQTLLEELGEICAADGAAEVIMQAYRGPSS
ncbi:hypothetical protein DFH06DRAFT_1140683 [Mycena polygramma]|nr:hypothetical protein DFH06DRAFT_1140683 [Mycena polygramma]